MRLWEIQEFPACRTRFHGVSPPARRYIPEFATGLRFRRGASRNSRVTEMVARYMADWNTQIIEEFRANDGNVGGNFAGAPIVLVHHRGRKSGREFVTPMMYLADSQPDTIYVFASKAGAPTDPDWYKNLIAAGRGRAEVGVETYSVTVRELTGEERDRIYDEQARRYPGFADYEAKTAGIRTIPVLALSRA